MGLTLTACMNFKALQIVPYVGEWIQFLFVHITVSERDAAFTKPDCRRARKDNAKYFQSRIVLIFFIFLLKKKFFNAFSYENILSVAMDCMCKKQPFVFIKHRGVALHFNQP